MEEEAVSRVREALSLSKLVDDSDAYFSYFSWWYERVSEDYVLHEATTDDKLNKPEDQMIIVKDPETGEDFIAVTKKCLPWAVLAAHAFLGYSTDTDIIAENLRDVFKIRGVTSSMVEDILLWSIPVMELGMTMERIAQFENNIAAENEEAAAIREMQYGLEIARVWKRVHQYHISHEKLNPLLDQAGLVFFALYKLETDPNEYVILFLDYLTQAFRFSTSFRFSTVAELQTNLRFELIQFMTEFGQPSAMFLMNPAQGRDHWLAKVLQEAIAVLMPLDTVFAVYKRGDGKGRSLPTRLVDVFNDVTEALTDKGDFFKEQQPFKYFLKQKNAAGWEPTFLNNCQMLERQFCAKQPRPLQFWSSVDNSCEHDLYIVKLPGTFTTIPRKIWSRIDIKNPFPTELKGKFVPTPMGQDARKAIKRIMRSSIHFSLAPNNNMAIQDLDFDDVSKSIVKHIFSTEIIDDSESTGSNASTEIIQIIEKRAGSESLTNERQSKRQCQEPGTALEEVPKAISNDQLPAVEMSGQVITIEEIPHEAGDSEGVAQQILENVETSGKLPQPSHMIQPRVGEEKGDAAQEAKDDASIRARRKEADLLLGHYETTRRISTEATNKKRLSDGQDLDNSDIPPHTPNKKKPLRNIAPKTKEPKKVHNEGTKKSSGEGVGGSEKTVFMSETDQRNAQSKKSEKVKADSETLHNQKNGKESTTEPQVVKTPSKAGKSPEKQITKTSVSEVETPTGKATTVNTISKKQATPKGDAKTPIAKNTSNVQATPKGDPKAPSVKVVAKEQATPKGDAKTPIAKSASKVHAAPTGKAKSVNVKTVSKEQVTPKADAKTPIAKSTSKVQASPKGDPKAPNVKAVAKEQATPKADVKTPIAKSASKVHATPTGKEKSVNVKAVSKEQVIPKAGAKTPAAKSASNVQVTPKGDPKAPSMKAVAKEQATPKANTEKPNTTVASEASLTPNVKAKTSSVASSKDKDIPNGSVTTPSAKASSQQQAALKVDAEAPTRKDASKPQTPTGKVPSKSQETPNGMVKTPSARVTSKEQATPIGDAKTEGAPKRDAKTPSTKAVSKEQGTPKGTPKPSSAKAVLNERATPKADAKTVRDPEVVPIERATPKGEAKTPFFKAIAKGQRATKENPKPPSAKAVLNERVTPKGATKTPSAKAVLKEGASPKGDAQSHSVKAVSKEQRTPKVDPKTTPAKAVSKERASPRGDTITPSGKPGKPWDFIFDSFRDTMFPNNAKPKPM